MSVFNLYEAYNAIYDEVLRLEFEELSEEFAGAEDLSDEELTNIIEESIHEILGEGFEIDEIEEILEEALGINVLDEARMTPQQMSARAERNKAAAAASEKSASAARKSGAAVVAKEKRAERVAKVKASVKAGVAKVKSNVASAKKSAEKKVKDVKQQSHVGAAKYADSRNLVKGAGLKTKSSKGRGELRSAVAKDIKSRVGAKIKAAAGKVKQKAASAAVSGYAAARSAKQAASDVKNKAVQSAKNKAAVANRNVKGAASALKSGAKSAVGKAARAVSTGAGKVASKLGEEVQRDDLFDVVLEHLVVEGYADTNQEAIVIMANMSEEWIQDILDNLDEAHKDLPTEKMRSRRFNVYMKTGEAAGSSRNEKIRGVLDAHKKDPEGEAEKARAKSKYNG